MTSTFSTNESEKIFDDVQSPKHYTDSKIEVIDYIEDKKLGFCLGNVIKYVSRAGKKHSADKTDKEKEIQDLNKAKWYLDRRIKELKEELCD
jgi:DNA-binding transcriptional MerR regulator